MESKREKQNSLLIKLFIGSEAIFFIALIVGYVYYTVFSPEWHGAKEYLDIKKTGIFSLFLYSSSFTLVFAEHLRKKDKRGGEILFLIITILLGSVFIVGQGMEYLSLFNKNIYPHTNIFGSAFFTLTGFHGLHVIIGLTCLVLLTGLTLNKVVYPKIDRATYSIGLYWHFVDIVWVFVFLTVYVWPYIL